MQSLEKTSETDFVELIADDRRFFVSITTLESNPEFVVTQILKNQKDTPANPLVHRVNEDKFLLDIQPSLLEKIVNEMRKIDGPNYEQNVRSILFTPQKLSGGSASTPVNTVVNTQVNAQVGVSRDETVQERSSIFKKPEQTQKQTRNYVDFSAISDRSDAQSLTGLLGAVNQENTAQDTQQAFCNISASNTSDTTQASHMDLSTTSTFRDSSSVPRGHHVYRPRKFEVNTLEK